MDPPTAPFPLPFINVRNKMVDLQLRWPIGNKIPGFDVAGVVKMVGAKVENFQVGDEVYGNCEVSQAQKRPT